MFSVAFKASPFARSLNAKTINNYVTVLRRAVDRAVANRAIDDNLVRYAYSAENSNCHFPIPFSRDEIEAVVAHMASEYPAGVANFVEFVLHRLRPSEVAARWSDVELEAQRVHAPGHRRASKKATTKTNTARMVLLNSRSHGGCHAPAVIDPARRRLLSLSIRAMGRRGSTSVRSGCSYWTPTLTALCLRYRKALQHAAAQLRDDDVDVGMTPASAARNSATRSACC